MLSNFNLQEEFKLHFDTNWFQKGDILENNRSIRLEVLEKPKRKWYHLFLQWLTFGWYKASWSYKVKVIK